MFIVNSPSEKYIFRLFLFADATQDDGFSHISDNPFQKQPKITAAQKRRRKKTYGKHIEPILTVLGDPQSDRLIIKTTNPPKWVQGYGRNHGGKTHIAKRRLDAVQAYRRSTASRSLTKIKTIHAIYVGKTGIFYAGKRILPLYGCFAGAAVKAKKFNLF